MLCGMRVVRQGRWGLLTRTLACSAVVLAVFLSGNAVAVDPHQAQITARDIATGMEINDSVKAWGVDEDIHLRAQCEFCAQNYEHDCVFNGATLPDWMDVSPEEPQDDRYEHAWGFSFESDGPYDVQASCMGQGTDTKTIKAVEVNELLIDDEPVDGTTVYYAVDDGDIIITASLTPSTGLGEMRNDFMQWTGATEDGDLPLEATVPLWEPGTTVVTCKAGNGNITPKSVTIVVVEAELVVYSSTQDLLDSNSFEVVLNPAVTGADFSIDIRRAGEATWYQIAAQQEEADYVHRVAGTFRVRGSATVGSVEVISPEEDVEVRFPEYASIVGDTGVIASANTAWAETLAATSDGSRREQGYWITLDTSSLVCHK